MNSVFLLIAVLFPIAGSVLIPLLPFQKKAHWQIYTEIITLITSALALFVVVNRPDELVLFTVSDTVRIVLQVDGLGMVFAGLISILWPIAVLYSFEYMNHEERQRSFFMFYIMTFVITLGIAFSANILTMYFFYESGYGTAGYPHFHKGCGSCHQKIYLLLPGRCCPWLYGGGIPDPLLRRKRLCSRRISYGRGSGKRPELCTDHLRACIHGL